MATNAEINYVATDIHKLLSTEMDASVPSWARSMIPENLVPRLSAETARTAIDSIDKYRSTHKKETK